MPCLIRPLQDTECDKMAHQTNENINNSIKFPLLHKNTVKIHKKSFVTIDSFNI